METLVRAAQQLFGIRLTGRQVAALIKFENELLAWNAKFNLTAIRDVEGIRSKHFLDSISCVQAWKHNAIYDQSREHDQALRARGGCR